MNFRVLVVSVPMLVSSFVGCEATAPVTESTADLILTKSGQRKIDGSYSRRLDGTNYDFYVENGTDGAPAKIVMATVANSKINVACDDTFIAETIASDLAFIGSSVNRAGGLADGTCFLRNQLPGTTIAGTPGNFKISLEGFAVVGSGGAGGPAGASPASPGSGPASSSGSAPASPPGGLNSKPAKESDSEGPSAKPVQPLAGDGAKLSATVSLTWSNATEATGCKDFKREDWCVAANSFQEKINELCGVTKPIRSHCKVE
jgi:hypothetical protein